LEKISGAEGRVWLEALKKFLRREPTWAEAMIYTPLEWTEDFGGCDFESIGDFVNLYNKKTHGGWRLPTDRELIRALRIMKPEGFTTGIYYHTSTLEDDAPFQNIIVYNHGQGLGSTLWRIISGYAQGLPHLRLCREMKIPV
jgi:hypothetical protein